MCKQHLKLGQHCVWAFNWKHGPKATPPALPFTPPSLQHNWESANICVQALSICYMWWRGEVDQWIECNNNFCKYEWTKSRLSRKVVRHKSPKQINNHAHQSAIQQFSQQLTKNHTPFHPHTHTLTNTPFANNSVTCEDTSVFYSISQVGNVAVI